MLTLRYANGQISHYVAIKEDITERKRIKDELKRLQEHLEFLVAQRTAEILELNQQFTRRLAGLMGGDAGAVSLASGKEKDRES